MSQIPIDHDALDSFCRRWGVVEIALFGSVLRDDFRSDSDVDVLVDFGPDKSRSLIDLIKMGEELSAMFGRKVDLFTRRGVERSTNPYRREEILGTARVIHAA
jgi:predicted nucleotidyltransferase